jgi:hypothetical protein
VPLPGVGSHLPSTPSCSVFTPSCSPFPSGPWLLSFCSVHLHPRQQLTIPTRTFVCARARLANANAHARARGRPRRHRPCASPTRCGCAGRVGRRQAAPALRSPRRSRPRLPGGHTMRAYYCLAWLRRFTLPACLFTSMAMRVRNLQATGLLPLVPLFVIVVLSFFFLFK